MGDDLVDAQGNPVDMFASMHEHPPVLSKEAWESVRKALQGVDRISVRYGNQTAMSRLTMNEDGTVTLNVDGDVYSSLLDQVMGYSIAPPPPSVHEVTVERLKQAVDDLERTVICPDDATADRVREIKGLPNLKVYVSPFVEPGKVYVIDTGAMHKRLREQVSEDALQSFWPQSGEVRSFQVDLDLD